MRGQAVTIQHAAPSLVNMISANDRCSLLAGDSCLGIASKLAPTIRLDMAKSNQPDPRHGTPRFELSFDQPEPQMSARLLP